jgi:hypothetical protein
VFGNSVGFASQASALTLSETNGERLNRIGRRPEQAFRS